MAQSSCVLQLLDVVEANADAYVVTGTRFCMYEPG